MGFLWPAGVVALSVVLGGLGALALPGLLEPAGVVALSVVLGGLGALALPGLLEPAGVVALSVVLGGLGALALLALLLLAALRLREKRRTEGSYRPSREEMGGGARAGPAPPGPPALRLPPEERLI
ncbi:protein crumbs homolog 3 [Molothrus aeneus]|uniref:protein crumbs homolog 3 n=1 Tax=Molothrus aeneus TaxID=84833 RepID=UPI0034579B8F